MWYLFYFNGTPAVAGRFHELGSVCPSVQTFSWDWLIIFFWNSAWCERPMWCCAWQQEFFKKKILPPKWAKNRGFLFNLLENLVINFFSIWFIKKFYIICCSCTNPILRKRLIPEIWTKMISKWWESLIFCMLIQIHGKLKLTEKY